MDEAHSIHRDESRFPVVEICLLQNREKIRLSTHQPGPRARRFKPSMLLSFSV